MNGCSRFRIGQAIRHLREGGLLAYPTEAVYGLGCDPYDRQAVDRISRVKGRPGTKSYILIAADYAQVEALLAPISAASRKMLLASWPGPVTWIVPAARTVPPWLVAADQTLAIRVTAHPLSNALCQAFGGPLISTSANPAGALPAKTATRVRHYFGPDSVKILAGPVGAKQKPTAIFDLRTGNRLR